ITGEPLPYGIAPNRNVIDELIGHALTQGIITKAVTADELFAPSTRALVGGFRQAGFAPCPISFPPTGSPRRRASRCSLPPSPRRTSSAARAAWRWAVQDCPPTP